MSMNRIRLALLAICCLSGLVPASAAADNAFGPPAPLAGPRAAAPDLAYDAQGNLTIVWEEEDLAASLWRLRAARMSPAGALGPVRTLATASRGTPGCCAQVAVDSQGRATVVWQARIDGIERVQAAQLDVDGLPLGPVATLSPAGEDAGPPRLAVDSLGRATVVWPVAGATVGRIESIRLLPDGTAESPQTLSEPGVDSSAPELALDEEDRAAVVWSAEDGVRLARIAADGAAGAAQIVSPPGDDGAGPRVVVDSQGRATVAWWHSREGRAARVDLDGTPGAVHTLSGPGEEIWSSPLLAVDSLDRVTAVWETFSHEIEAVRIEADGTLGPIHPVSGPARLASQPDLTMGAEDRPLVVWGHPDVLTTTEARFPPECEEIAFDSDSDAIHAAHIGADGTPGPAVAISEFGEQSMGPAVAAGPGDLTAVVWQSFERTYFCSGSAFAPRLKLAWGRPPPPSVGVDPGERMPQPVTAPSVVGPPGPTEPPVGGVLRLHRKAFVRGRHLVLRGVCVGEGGASCSGRLRLRAPGGGAVAFGRFGCEQGTRALRLPLSRLGRRLLEEPGPRLFRLRAEGTGAEPATVAIVRP